MLTSIPTAPLSLHTLCLCSTHTCLLRNAVHTVTQRSAGPKQRTSRDTVGHRDFMSHCHSTVRYSTVHCTRLLLQQATALRCHSTLWSAIKWQSISAIAPFTAELSHNSQIDHHRTDHSDTFTPLSSQLFALLYMLITQTAHHAVLLTAHLDSFSDRMGQSHCLAPTRDL